MHRKPPRRFKPLPPRAHFFQRLAKMALAAFGLIVFSQLLGMAGYMFFEGMTPVDSFVNAAMLLSGMGPLDPPKTHAGKIFAGLYALYSGLILILATGLILSPVFHRVLHRFHLEQEDGDEEQDS